MAEESESPKLHKLKDLIGGSTKAISDSYNHTTQSSLDYLQGGFHSDNTTKNIRVNVSGKTFEFPIVSLFPPPVLKVKEAEFTMQTKIKDIEEEEIIVDLNSNDKDTTVTFKLTNDNSTISYHNLLESMNKHKTQADDVIDAPTSIFLNPDNGHYYQYITLYGISWTEASIAAQTHIHNGITGHLVTIRSESENNFVAGLVPNGTRVWIGLTDQIAEEQYAWVTGEPLDYTNWESGQPDNHNTENYVDFNGETGKWNDSQNQVGYITGFIIEYSS